MPHLRRVHLYDLVPERAERLAEHVRAASRGSGVEVVVAARAEDAVRPANLVMPVTTTMTGYIGFDWLRSGTLVVNVSLDDVLPDVVFRAEQLDYAPGANRPTTPGSRLVGATLGEVVAGTALGRAHPDEAVLVNPFGMTLEDVALADEVYRIARRDGIATRLRR